MSTSTKVTLHKGGTAEKTLAISEIKVPDLWHLHQWLEIEARRHNLSTMRDQEARQWFERAAKDVLECWHLAHDFKKHIEES